jgi:hypothetical protein
MPDALLILDPAILGVRLPIQDGRTLIPVDMIAQRPGWQLPADSRSCGRPLRSPLFQPTYVALHRDVVGSRPATEALPNSVP